MPTTSVEGERHCHHLQVGNAVGGKQLFMTRSPARGKEESRWRGVGPAARLSFSQGDWLAQPMC
jgi:hypothetical protein